MKVKNLNKILKQEPAVNLLTQALRKKRLSHAYLFTGPKGVGKETTAWAFLFHLFCEKDKENPCGECRACKKIEKEIHPDIYILFPEKREITIGQIREVIDFLKYRPLEAEYKVIFVKEADKMNPEAGNALLKSLEEPPFYAIFILLTENFSKLLPTIVSRSQIVRFRTIPKGIIKEFLKKNFLFEEEVADTLAEVSFGSIGKAITIAEKGILEELNSFVKAGFSKSPLKKFKVAERLSFLPLQDLDDFFYLLTLWVWRSYLKRKVDYPYPRAFPEELFEGDPYSAIKTIYEVKNALDSYVNPELSFYYLLNALNTS
ncbi:MAG: DNA polymerase III [Thermodesulfobacterium sp.]|uniref:DNA polymerase III n=1 Tax=Candidatus Thermodesulfobacterium syntrophicum TaxID=3060442 RepID=A0AAE3P3X6_9BACT|nr:DNA polymerase III [Candidatus Thermodesulfobacterium syntrophicum]